MTKSPRRKEVLGLIGLGLMGRAFTRNWVEDGYQVVGTDPDPSARRKFRKLGGRLAKFPREVAEQSDWVFLSLPNSKISLQVARGKDGLLAFEERKGPQIVLDTTTAAPEDSRKAFELFRKKGVEFLDACISGNSGMVAERRGLFLIGGNENAYQKVTPLLQRMLSDHLYAGPAGNGASLKVIINYLTTLERCVNAEALRLGIRAGLEPGKLLDALQRSSARNGQLDNRGSRMIGRKFTGTTGTLDISRKDLGLGLKLGSQAGALTPFGKMGRKVIEEAVSSGYINKDGSVVYQVFIDREKKKNQS